MFGFGSGVCYLALCVAFDWEFAGLLINSVDYVDCGVGLVIWFADLRPFNCLCLDWFWFVAFCDWCLRWLALFSYLSLGCVCLCISDFCLVFDICWFGLFDFWLVWMILLLTLLGLLLVDFGWVPDLQFGTFTYGLLHLVKCSWIWMICFGFIVLGLFMIDYCCVDCC